MRFEDHTASSSDIIQDTLSLDVLWVNCTALIEYSEPVISNYGAIPEETEEENPILFFLTITDDDNQVMTYVRLYLNATYYGMTENDTEDDSTDDGKTWYLSKSDIPVGWYNYYFATIDSESPEITTTPDILTINTNEAPYFTSSPSANIHNNTYYSYHAEASDTSELTFALDGNITGWASINSVTGIVSGTPIVLGNYWQNISASDDFNHLVWQNTSVTVFSDTPYFTSTPITTGTVNVTYMYDSSASDNESEPLTYGLEGNITNWATIDSSTGVITGTPTIAGVYWMNVTVTDYNNDVVYQSTEVVIDAETISSGISAIQAILLVFIMLFLGIAIMYGLGAFD